jgi:hypothetical protein
MSRVPNVRAGVAACVVACLGAVPAVRAADPDVSQLFPRLHAYYDCGENYVRVNLAPSQFGARQACRQQLAAYLEIVTFMSQMTNPRDGHRAAVDDPAVVEHVASTRATVEAEFASRVGEKLGAR